MQIDIDFIRFGTFVLFGLHLFECDDRSKRTSQKNKEFRLKQNRYNLGKRLKRREKERKEEKNAERTLDDRKMFTFSSICMHNSHINCSTVEKVSLKFFSLPFNFYLIFYLCLVMFDRVYSLFLRPSL